MGWRSDGAKEVEVSAPRTRVANSWCEAIHLCDAVLRAGGHALVSSRAALPSWMARAIGDAGKDRLLLSYPALSQGTG
jgi:hypothetical protein